MKNDFYSEQSGHGRYLFKVGLKSLTALLVGAAFIAFMHTQGKLIRTDWLQYLWWWVPVIVTGWVCRRSMNAEAGNRYPPISLWPPLLLGLCMVAFLYSSSTHDQWFYLNRWLPATQQPFHALMPRFVLLTAILTPVLVVWRKKTWIVLLILLVGLQAACFESLWVKTDGLALYRDDHPSFMFRLQEFRDTFPSLVNYNPYWNGGTIHYVGTTSGIYGFGLALWPLWKFFPIHSVYTLGVGLVFIILAPLLAAASMRIMKGDAFASCCAGILGLGVSQHFFLWMLHYGTVGAATSTVFVLPVSACVFRIVWLDRREPWLAAALIFCTLFLLLWPPGAIMCMPIALSMLFNIGRWTKGKILFLVACTLVVLIFYLKPLLVILFQGNFVLRYVIDSEDFARTNTAPLFTMQMLDLGWQHLWDHVRQGHPILIFLGLAGCFFLPYRSVRRWYGPILVGFALLAGWGHQVKPNLQLSRMAIPMFFVAIPPASLLVSRLLRSQDVLTALPRAVLVALLFVGGYSTSRLYRNQGPAPYVAMPELAQNLVDWIKTNVPEGGRVLYTGKTVHAYGRGHLAYLPILTQREMMACDYYHFPPKYVEYNYPPRPFRKDRETFARFMELYNVTHIVTYHKNWKEFVASSPEDYEKVHALEYLDIFKVKQEPGMLLEGKGTVSSAFNRIDVLLTEPAEEIVLKYNWDERLSVRAPASVFPFEAGDEVTLLGVRPGGRTNLTVRYRNRL